MSEALGYAVGMWIYILIVADTIVCSNAGYDATTAETKSYRYFCDRLFLHCMSLLFSTHHWVQYICAIIHSKLVNTT